MLSSFILNNEMKLMYLMRYCAGVASGAIQCRKSMPPNEEYSGPMSILRQRFGRPSIIVRKLFEAIKGNGSQLGGESKAHSDLQECIDFDELHE
ncbi:unnamed protein product [Trichobilharzia regenti]|nr:unnamed protein product [Trichobilharzia regenti]